MAKRKSYEEMTAPERRVAIAKDVITMIQTKRMQASTGNYMEFMGSPYCPPPGLPQIKYNSLEPVDEETLERPIKKREVRALQESCEVCALGGLFLSRIAVGNTATWDDLNLGASNFVYADQQTCIDGLRGAFTNRQLSLIEAAFECDSMFCLPNIPDNIAEAAEEFGMQFGHSEDRLLAICQNIVDNEGNFVPTQQYEVSIR